MALSHDDSTINIVLVIIIIVIKTNRQIDTVVTTLCAPPEDELTKLHTSVSPGCKSHRSKTEK